MNLRLGIYDIFSRIVPGGVYLFAALEFARVLGWLRFDWGSLIDLGLLPSLGLIITAYVVGTAMDRVGSAWYLLFNRGMGDRILDEFKEEHKKLWQLDIDDEDWPVLRAFIYVHNREVGEEIDRHNALCIMLRNISLGLLFLAASQIAQFVLTMNWLLLVLVTIMFLLSYQLAVQARMMREWFYRSIYETIIAYRLKIEEIVKPAESLTTEKKGQVKR
jgi:hypothetical protein